MCGVALEDIPPEDEAPEASPPSPETDDAATTPETEEAPGDDARAQAENVTIAKDELEALRKQSAEADNYKDMYQRALADKLNYQKRARKEMDSIRERAIQDFAAELLPVLDDFERALKSLDEPSGQPDGQAFAEGVRMIENHLLKALEKHGIKPIEAKGKPFDPTYHEALMQQPTDEYPEGTVVEELRKGYVAGDRVLRAAQVVVASKPSS